MTTEEGFTGELFHGGTFSQLLESGGFFLKAEKSLISHEDPAKIIYSGDRSRKPQTRLMDAGAVSQRLRGCDSSSPAHSSGHGSLKKSRKVESTNAVEPPLLRQDRAAGGRCRKTCEKPRTESKRKKEKLGERISALQKLVSPFGKTDTASVLHEAMGYIRFLHDQVQVLSSPYMQNLPSATTFSEEEEKQGHGLRDRGLCLVPVSCTINMAESNGADLWSPATLENRTSPKHQHCRSLFAMNLKPS